MNKRQSSNLKHLSMSLQYVKELIVSKRHSMAGSLLGDLSNARSYSSNVSSRSRSAMCVTPSGSFYRSSGNARSGRLRLDGIINHFFDLERDILERETISDCF